MTKHLNEIQIVLDELEHNHFEAYLVGGFVRDLLLNRETHDIDCATNATPDEIEGVFKNFKQSHVGKKHGTIGVKIRNVWIEITTFRIDVETKDHRRPKAVIFTSSIKEDVLRRDFTMNALAINSRFEILDYVNGQDDIMSKLIRCVGNPEIRFYEDSLRILRAIRFACQLDFRIDELSLDAMHKHAYLLNVLAVERIYQEFTKILEARVVYKYLALTRDIISVFLPEILEINDHDLKMIDLLNTPLKRYCLFFLHKNEESIHMRCNALKMPKKLVQNCLDFYACYKYEFSAELINLKRMMQRYPSEIIIEAIETQKILSNNRYSEESYQLILKLIKDKVVLSIKDLAIDGYDLMALNIKGKAIQVSLNKCLEAVMLNKVENTKEALIQWVNLT